MLAQVKQRNGVEQRAHSGCINYRVFVALPLCLVKGKVDHFVCLAGVGCLNGIFGKPSQDRKVGCKSTMLVETKPSSML